MKLQNYNFDQTVLEDSLFQALKNSQQTRNLISLRAQQIVQQITKNVWVTQLKEKLNQQKQKFCQEHQKYLNLEKQLKKIMQKQEKKKKSIVYQLRTENQKILNKFNLQLQKRNSQSQNMQQQIQNLSHNFMVLKQQNETMLFQLQEKSNELKNVLKENQLKNQAIKFLQSQLSNSEAQFQKLFKNHQEQMEKNFNKNKINTKQIQQLKDYIKELNTTIEGYQQKNQFNIQSKILKENQQKNTYQQKNSLLQRQLKKISHQKQRLRNQLNQSEQNYLLLKKQIGRFKQKYKKFEQESNKMKLNHIQIQNQKDFINQNQNQVIKQLQEKIKKTQSQAQYIYKKKLGKQMKLMSILKNNLYILKNIREQNQMLKKFIIQKVTLLRESTQSSVMRIVNHISTQLNEYFQQCILEIRKAREQKYLAQQEAKLKNEVIQHLDKLLNNESKSVYELRNQLRIKKKQEEKLRKKLKSHYQQTDKKLQNFQKKYISILKDQY